ncbi:MAG TPA: PEP/pyruvate-binding domain-containing protein [Acidobacteriota bacterium]|nr:PEP/pyruvate-binding domain-containing protein [Acidobacteriota bacterium]
MGLDRTVDELLASLQERAKELNCLYRVEEILSKPEESLDTVCADIVEAIPPGWQHPEICEVKIAIENKTFTSPGFKETPWVQVAEIVAQNVTVGTIHVGYTRDMEMAGAGPFLAEEARLIETIAERLAEFIVHQRMRQVIESLESLRLESPGKGHGRWLAVLELLQQTDQNLYQRLSQKMLCHLCWTGVSEAEGLYRSCVTGRTEHVEEAADDASSISYRSQPMSFLWDFSSAAFRIAEHHLSSEEILELLQKWIQEDKLSLLAQVVNRNLSLADVADAIRRYQDSIHDRPLEPTTSMRGIKASLIRRLLSDRQEYVDAAREFVDIPDLQDLLQRVIFSHDSQGKLGGKGAGLVLAAQVMKKAGAASDLLRDIKTPKTWYISSDVLRHFIRYQGLDHVIEQKYKEIDQVTLEYPHIVRLFKTARFPSEIVRGMAMALDDLGDDPLIVRSSSLLEDRMGAAFAGKYKSLFLANHGSKQKRLDALLDAVAEVYASVFNPEAIRYRVEHNLLDFDEEMGVLIQEVVGTRAGKYFLPTFAGAAFSENDLGSFPNVKRKDGLIRLVPGLDVRGWNRPEDDFPMLVAPGSLQMRINVEEEEILRYCPKRADVINLETGTVQTLELNRLLKLVSSQIPGIEHVISVVEDGHICRPGTARLDQDDVQVAACFEGLLTDTPFVVRMKQALRSIEEALGAPVRLDFASDGRDLYLLQCGRQFPCNKPSEF